MQKIRRTIRRRRYEGKTDYKSRFGLIKSGKPRVVFRKTNRHIVGQIVTSDVAQDKVVIGVTSKDLMSLGWPENLKGSLKNLTASYLTGYLLGKKSTEIKEAVFDIGMNRNIAKSKIYAFLKGSIDAGIEIPHNEKMLPEEDTLTIETIGNEKTGKLIKEIKEKIGGLK